MIIQAETVFFRKYSCKRVISRDAFGAVVLVEALDDKSLFTVKIISKERLRTQNKGHEDYMKSEIEGMKSIDSKYVCKLYDFEEDENNYMMLMEYCDGGDLLNLQATQPKQVFSLEDTTTLLRDVIYGLEDMHKHGYTHRDIRM